MNTRKFCVLLASVVFASGLSARAETPAAVFKAGAGKRDVTPKEPVPMWGYGARHAALSTGALDPLYASAVVIQAGEKKLAIVGLDLAPAARWPRSRSRWATTPTSTSRPPGSSPA